MDLYQASAEPVMNEPVMLLALSGWVDAASIATDAAELIAGMGAEIGHFDPDRLFDYRSSRPILHFRGGDLEEVVWPSLRVVHTRIGDRDLLVVHGNEPDFRWKLLGAEFIELARRFGTRLLITLGAVPAMVPHTRPVEIVATSADLSLLLDDDVVLSEELIVPGAAVSILRLAALEAGLDAVGYWVRAPHYLNRPYHDGVIALLDKVVRQTGISLDLTEMQGRAVAQRADLDRIAEARSEIREYIERLESAGQASSLGMPDELPTADELAAEVERYLRQASGED